MNILYLDHAPVFGGAERVLLHLVLALKNCRPLIATRPGSPLLGADGVETVPIPFPRLTSPAAVRSIQAIVRLIRNRQIDLIHSNTARAHIIGALVSKLTRTPLVWMIHDNTLPLPLAHFLGVVPERIITVSKWLAAFYGSKQLSSKILTIYNGVRIKHPPALPLDRFDHQRPTVLHVGRLIREKGPHLFVEAARLVLHNVPHARFVLLGGQTDSEYAVNLRRKVEAEALKDRIVILGHQDDVDHYYATTDLVVYCALQPEGLPMVLLEAMAWGKPVVASNLGGATEIVLDNITGRLVEPGDPGEIAAGVCEFVLDRAKAFQVGLAGRQRVQKVFNLEVQVAKIRDIYDECISQIPRQSA